MLTPALRMRLVPSSLVADVRGITLTEFMREYGDTQLLLIALDGDDGTLRSGLMAMAATRGMALQPAAHWSTCDTVLGLDDQPAPSTSIPPPPVFDEEALAELLEGGAHFVTALRKRRAGDRWPERIRIGRSSSADVVLQHGGVSKVHAWLEMDEDGVFYLADAESTNGTRVNDEPLERNEMVRVRPGDRIELGSVRATLCPPETLWHALR